MAGRGTGRAREAHGDQAALVDGAGGGARDREKWTAARRELFLAMLARTADAEAAALAAGMSVRGAYALKYKDAAFARGWRQALDQAFEALDLLLLRTALFGAEEVEITEDGVGAVKSRKVKRGVPIALGRDLSKGHAADLARRAGQEDAERPDSGAVTRRLGQALQRLRARAAAREAEAAKANDMGEGLDGSVGAGAVGGAGPAGARARAGGAGCGRDRAAGP
ncbi:MAG: hypothetical protein QHC40_06970 [Sphingobium sp.]|nr:hypothetical protein [Sphingobium sp.]